MAAQLLVGRPAGDAVAVAERLLAVQAQDQRGFRLAVRARTRGLEAADVERALTVDRTLVVSWLNRGTLHLVRREDYWWLHALAAPTTLTSNGTRLRQEGVTEAEAERGVRIVADAVASDGPLTRAQLGERLAVAGVRTEGQALVHLLVLASLRGSIVRGPVVGREQAFALARDWIGPPEPVDRARALGELARRYLAGHGPADDRDLARWAGLPLRDARAGLGSIGAELHTRPDGLVALRRHRKGDLGSPRLLGAFDPLLLGWRSRDPILGGRSGIVTNNGVFRPFALAGGRAVATWTLADGVVRLAPFADLDPSDLDALAADAVDVLRFLGVGAGSTPMTVVGSDG